MVLNCSKELSTFVVLKSEARIRPHALVLNCAALGSEELSALVAPKPGKQRAVHPGGAEI